MLSDLILALIVCSDGLLTAAAYGMSGIRIPHRAAFILSFIGAAALTIAMYAAQPLCLLLPPLLCRCMGAGLLALLGVITIIRSILPASEPEKTQRSPHFLDVCLHTAHADADHSKSLSSGEAFLLALVLSLDSVAAGFGAGMSNASPIRCGILSLVLGFLFVEIGQWLGRKCRCTQTHNPDWIAGALLIALAVLQLW